MPSIAPRRRGRRVRSAVWGQGIVLSKIARASASSSFPSRHCASCRLRNAVRGALGVVLIVLASSCGPKHKSPPPAAGADETILARIGSEQITAAEFGAEWARRGLGASGEAVSAEAQKKLLDVLIQEKAVLAQARATGRDRDPETRALIERLVVTRFTEAEFARRFAAEPQVAEAEIARFYESNPARFQIAPALRAGLLWLKCSPRAQPEVRAAIREQAEQLRAQALVADAAGFKRLVQEHSEDQATRYTGGDTGWLVAGQPPACDPAVLAVAQQLESPGAVGPVLECAQGFCIVRLLERRPAGRRPLDDVHDAIRYELQQAQRQQREQEFFAEMKRGLRIEVNPAALPATVPVNPVSHPPPPKAPGS
jgi:parvulin-like peptidyl-prolyl isomerase